MAYQTPKLDITGKRLQGHDSESKIKTMPKWIVCKHMSTQADYDHRIQTYLN